LASAPGTGTIKIKVFRRFFTRPKAVPANDVGDWGEELPGGIEQAGGRAARVGSVSRKKEGEP
jgi:hypothetical protein